MWQSINAGFTIELIPLYFNKKLMNSPKRSDKGLYYVKKTKN